MGFYCLQAVGQHVLSYADRLINANLQHKDTYLFPSGVVLTLPEIQKPVNSLLPPWKRKGASA